MNPQELIAQLVALRKKQGVSLRELSRKADIAPASLSAIENGLSSPTLATLHKLLGALGTDFASFIAGAEGTSPNSPVFPAASMHALSDRHRNYTFMLPKREDMKMQMVHETIGTSERESEWEVHGFDLGCCLLEGGPLKLEIDGVGEWPVNAGDAFYVKQGQRHRATNVGRTSAKLMSVIVPPEY